MWFNQHKRMAMGIVVVISAIVLFLVVATGGDEYYSQDATSSKRRADCDRQEEKLRNAEQHMEMAKVRMTYAKKNVNATVNKRMRAERNKQVRHLNQPAYAGALMDIEFEQKREDVAIADYHVQEKVVTDAKAAYAKLLKNWKTSERMCNVVGVTAKFVAKKF